MTAIAPSSRRISLFQIALVLPWIALVRDAFSTIRDNSFLWHIRAGELQAIAGEVLTTDPFSLRLAGERWITQSWLAELLYAWAERSFGVGFAGVMLLLASSITVLGLGLLAYRYSKSVPATAVVVVLSAVLLPGFLVPRPVLFSYPLLVLTMLSWERRSDRWAVPFIIWIWASVHGSFVIGLVFVAVSILARKEWKALGVAVASGIPALFTAQGLAVVEMLVDFVESRPYLAFIEEWGTPDLLQPSLVPMLLGLLILIYGGMKGRLASNQLWVIAPFLVLAFSAERSVGVGWVVLAPLVAASLGGFEIKRFQGFPARTTALAVLVILLLPFSLTSPVEIDDERFPVEAAAFLSPEPTFHDDVVGGYLIWRFGTTHPVFIDDRVELHQEAIEEFANVRFGKQPVEPILEQHQIRQALLRTDEPAADDLTKAGWDTVYSDESFLILRAPN